MDYLTLPIDEESQDRLAAGGLGLELIDTADAPSFLRWLEAEGRGFHEGRQSPETLAEIAAALASRRTTAVIGPRVPRPDAVTPDPAAISPTTDEIVGTANAWPLELMVPGHRTVTAWAISGVTVAATHRRQGIARALLEAELRTARALGIPIAALTVSEATIYGRFGFAPAVRAVDLTIDTRRAKWVGPEAPGTLRFVSADELYAAADAILESARATIPGSVTAWRDFHRRSFLATPANADRGKKYRFVQYDDIDGIPQGYAMFRLNHDGDDFSSGVLELASLVSATPHAYAALWRFMLDMDLVTTVTAPLRSVDEPLLWQVSDMRGVRSTAVSDHLWIRILDVEAALAARQYAGPAQIVLDILDDLGFASGTFSLIIDGGGVATVARSASDAGTVSPAFHLALPVTALSALYLGGVRATTLAAAGVLHEVVPGSAAAVDRAFASEVTPWLGFWF